MTTKRVLFSLISFLLIFSLGCFGATTGTKERKKVTEAQVKAFQNQKRQKRMDIYIPIKEQYATSKHAQSLKELLNRKDVQPTCYQCMSAEYNIAPANQKPAPKDIKHSITCAVCHVLTPTEFKLRLSPLETCTGCHNNSGKAVIPGEVVHHPQKEMFLGYGAIGVPQTPDSKYKSGLTCIECHMPNEAHTFDGKTPAQALKEHTESICVMCHADQSEEEFAKEVARMQAKIKESCAVLDKGLKASLEKINQNKQKGMDMTQAQKVYNVVYTNVSFIEADKSMGIHNFDYTTKILDYTKMREKELNNLLNI